MTEQLAQNNLPEVVSLVTRKFEIVIDLTDLDIRRLFSLRRHNLIGDAQLALGLFQWETHLDLYPFVVSHQTREPAGRLGVIFPDGVTHLTPLNGDRSLAAYDRALQQMLIMRNPSIGQLQIVRDSSARRGDGRTIMTVEFGVNGLQFNSTSLDYNPHRALVDALSEGYQVYTLLTQPI